MLNFMLEAYISWFTSVPLLINSKFIKHNMAQQICFIVETIICDAQSH